MTLGSLMLLTSLYGLVGGSHRRKINPHPHQPDLQVVHFMVVHGAI